ELVQEALNRWWGPLMQFHGNPISKDEDPMYVWRIKSQGNEEARQQFLDGYVPQIWELGLTVPDPKLRKSGDGVWEYGEPDWHEQYGRRQESEALWVVPRGAIREVHDFPDELHKTYHRVDGYSLKEKLRLARERAVSAKSADALSADGG